MLLSYRALLLLFAQPADPASAALEVEAAAALLPNKAPLLPSFGSRAFSCLRLLLQIARSLNMTDVAHVVPPPPCHYLI